MAVKVDIDEAVRGIAEDYSNIVVLAEFSGIEVVLTPLLPAADPRYLASMFDRDEGEIGLVIKIKVLGFKQYDVSVRFDPCWFSIAKEFSVRTASPEWV